ncbi:tol-pal system protein YbgF [Sulfitobacter sp. D35]|uniref:tol-pal system protein YbgF n=1 Tax=Sulfitobacter sp. D35 TaxID=3083252 RepID=UPI00296EA412|nr:tol-pal system protein YbgF [Sulfitobacter sp. D35]MDW4499503.1 tol-pal system protein YbgF [Sulfitobacter sp. D35]
MIRRAAFLVACLALLPFSALAQDETLADIRQELNVLYVEVQKLKRELSTTGAPGVSTAGNSVIERVSAMESELQRLTSKAEELEFRINSIVEDGTNRIGDLEFRLVELEGGDVSSLGETTTLGGEAAQSGAAAGNAPAATPPPATQPAAPGGAQLAVGEETDFKAAQESLAAGNYQQAANQFADFTQTYPGGPLGPAAELGRGTALENLGDSREAARAYLASFSADPTGQTAPEALFRLGRALGALGQTQEACVTLGEVGVRFPNAPEAQQAASQRGTLGCS